jgi:hypothetical protein
MLAGIAGEAFAYVKMRCGISACQAVACPSCPDHASRSLASRPKAAAAGGHPGRSVVKFEPGDRWPVPAHSDHRYEIEPFATIEAAPPAQAHGTMSELGTNLWTSGCLER